MTAALLAAILATFTASEVYLTRRWYGPLTHGSIRWRAEAPQREARRQRRELLAHLTDDDRAWLHANGWTG